MKRRSVLFLALITAISALSLEGQEASRFSEPIQAHPEGDEAVAQLKSPYCPGLMLEVCSHPKSKILRDSLQMMAHQGAQADSIVSWMLATHGEEYLAVPRTSGSGLLAWVIPPLALLVGLVIVVVALKHFRAQRGAGPEGAGPPTEEEESVLSAALEELKSTEEVTF